eukprot:SAG31_NODE_30920_length_374_cov_1.298182_1_plen_22_part_10
MSVARTPDVESHIEAGLQHKAA